MGIIVNFKLFLEQYLEEAPSTSHGKVETAIRGLHLSYKNDRADKGRAFYLDHDYVVVSFNSGRITLAKRGVKTIIAEISAVDVLDTNKIVGKVEGLLKKNAPEIFGKNKEKSGA